jgi:thiamine biosynthesis protein ThiS
MKITVNGEEQDFAAGLTIEFLLTELGLKPERLAVELNGRIVRRAEWSSTVLAAGDRVEIVHFVGGG